VRLIVALVTAALVGVGCMGGDEEPSGESAELVTVSNIQQIARTFNEDTGHPRLVLLLSPT
jgi:hypothetical protein